MLGHHLLTLYRTLMRHPLYAVLNVAGLAFGIAVFLVLFLFVRFETGFDRWIPHADRIYIMRAALKLPGMRGEPGESTTGATLDWLQADYRGLLGTRLSIQPVEVRTGGRSVDDVLTMTDPAFFRVFDLPLLAGRSSTALADPSSLVLTQQSARKYFGKAPALGRTLTVTVLGQSRAYRVTGVIRDLPPDSDLRIRMLARIEPDRLQATYHNFDQMGFGSVRTFLVFPAPAQARALAADLDRFVDRRGASQLQMPPLKPHQLYRLSLTPLTRLHLIHRADAVVVIAMALVGTLTLFVAALNYVNLASARAGFRAREVAVRKVMGATRAQLIGQFLGESVAVSLVAGLLGLAMAELALPMLDAATGLPLRLSYLGADGAVMVLLLVVVAVGLGAGLYPAFVLSAFQPAAVLASARMPGGGRGGARLRQALVALQFAIAIGFIAVTAVLFTQIQYLRRADLGFERNGLIVAPTFKSHRLTEAQREALLDGFRRLPGVVGATQSDTAPGDDDYRHVEGIRAPGRPLTGAPPAVGEVVTGQDFFAAYRARLLAGRPLDRAHRLDDMAGRSLDQLKAEGQNIVVDAEAARSFGFRSPQAAIGRTVLDDLGPGAGMIPMTIVGVIEDMRFHSPHARTSPTAYVLKSRDIMLPVAAVRYAGTDPARVEQGMRRVWGAVAHDVPFEARTAQLNLSTYYRPEEQRTLFLAMGAAVAILIGCVGLYGLASFAVASRTREVGIRKTLGAGASDILRLMARQFLGPVAVASLIAWPLAWWAMRDWLAGFAERIALGPGYFLGATAVALAIAAATVAGHGLRIARAAPAAALRYE